MSFTDIISYSVIHIPTKGLDFCWLLANHSSLLLWMGSILTKLPSSYIARYNHIHYILNSLEENGFSYFIFLWFLKCFSIEILYINWFLVGLKEIFFYLILMYLHCKNQNVVNKGLIFAFSNVYDGFLQVSCSWSSYCFYNVDI